MSEDGTGNSSHTPSIHILDDDVLLNMFFLYRPAIFDGDEDDFVRVSGGRGWDRERWWYKLAQVCQRWRTLILGSPSYLDLCLVCTYGTPIADMLAHSPPLPLVIDFFDQDWVITADDEEEIILALEKRDRVRRVRLGMPVPSLQKLIMTIDEEYPVLEYLIVLPRPEDTSTAWMLPEALQAPHLCHLVLKGFVLPVGSQLFTTAVGLVTLSLYIDHPFAYFQPSTLLQWVSFMPQLEKLLVFLPYRDVERQPMHTEATTHVTLPNLRWMVLEGVSAYVEEVLHRITTPRLETLDVHFFKQLTYSVPRLLHFVNKTKTLRFDCAKFEFSRDDVSVMLDLRWEPQAEYALSLYVYTRHLDWQVSSVTQIFNSLSQISSTVEHLSLEYEVHSRSSMAHNTVNRTVWRNFLRPFVNVKTFHVQDGLVNQLSRSLRPEDGELPQELLPELQVLTYSGHRDAFTPFIDARQNAGFPVTLTLRR